MYKYIEYKKDREFALKYISELEKKTYGSPILWNVLVFAFVIYILLDIFVFTTKEGYDFFDYFAMLGIVIFGILYFFKLLYKNNMKKDILIEYFIDFENTELYKYDKKYKIEDIVYFKTYIFIFFENKILSLNKELISENIQKKIKGISNG